MPRIIKRTRAARDLLECFVAIGEDSEQAAVRFLDSAEKTLRLIAGRPAIGRPADFPNPALAGVRRFPIKGFERYLIFYRPVGDGIEVIRVIHGARDIERIFEA